MKNEKQILKFRTAEMKKLLSILRVIFLFVFGKVLLLIFLAAPVLGQGLQIDSAGIGVYVVDANVGLSVLSAKTNGIGIFLTQQDGVNIFQSLGDGFYVGDAGDHGLYIDRARKDGLHIDRADDYGVYIVDAGEDAIRIEDATDYAIRIDNSGDDAIRVTDAGDDGVDVHGATGDGVYVTGVGRDGVFVNSDVGRYSLHIWGNKTVFENPSGHIAQIYNRNGNPEADVLALRVRMPTASGWPGAGNNFITFFNMDSVALGRVEGNGSGGVTYGTSGADYAECLPLIDLNESFQPGDLVGIHEGRISHETIGAAQVMVVTDQPAVLGNSSDLQDGYLPVSFIGQIPIRVSGLVKAGDWIVPDGNQKGIGIAIPASAVTPSHQIVGRAWESSTDPGIKRVNTAVGLDQSEALMHMIHVQQQQIDQLQQMVMQLKERS